MPSPGRNYLLAWMLSGWAAPAQTITGTPEITDGDTLSIGAVVIRRGRSVSGAGDVNGDGIDDLIIGAPGGFNCSSAGVRRIAANGRD